MSHYLLVHVSLHLCCCLGLPGLERPDIEPVSTYFANNSAITLREADRAKEAMDKQLAETYALDRSGRRSSAASIANYARVRLAGLRITLRSTLRTTHFVRSSSTV